jgi:hypothetical protein
MTNALPASTRFRCSHGILKPRFTWSPELGKPVPLTDQTPNPLCSICSGPLTADRRAPRTEAVESTETELMESV